MKYLVTCLILASLWTFESCCAGDDCDSGMNFSLRFEDSNGANLITENLLSGDSIEFFNIYKSSNLEKIDTIYYTLNDRNEFQIYFPYYTDSLKVNIGNVTVGAFDIELTNYRDKGCCDGYENYNVFYDNEFCGDCNGTTLVIAL